MGSAGEPVDLEGEALSPERALEETLRPALERPPCVIAFSGGRDSSLVLSAARAASLRFGLPPPVAATLRFPKAPATEESSWQELLIGRLGLSEWIRIDVDFELELAGPVARRVLAEHGPFWPPNAHLMVPLLEVARGGTLLTGLDGDGLFGSWRWSKAAEVLSGRRAPVLRDAGRIALALAPISLRQALIARRQPFPPERWLRPRAQVEASRAWAAERASEPCSWQDWIRWYSTRRYHRIARESLDRIASGLGARVQHPFLEPRFLQAIAGAGGRWGFGSRTAMLRALFSQLLPEDLLERTSKARFDEALWGPQTREAARSFSGEGIDPDLVDPEALRSVWLEPRPDFRSASLFHAFLLERERRR